MSGQTPAELGYRSTLCWFRRCWFRRCCRRCWFCRCWFRRCFVFRRWYRWCNVKRIAFVIFWIVLGSFVFASCGGFKKLGMLPGPATALSSRRFFSRFFCSTEGIQARYVYPTDTLHHNEVEQELQDTFSLQRTQLTTLHRSIQSTLFPNYNGVFKKKSE